MGRIVPVVRTFLWVSVVAMPTLAASPGAGDQAPPIAAETVLAGPAASQISWEALRGQAVVIEFWATWCAPCVAAIPHLNELVEEFDGQPVRFLSISDEEREHVLGFVERRPIAGWLLLDGDRSIFDAYGVTSIPHAVLVDGTGTIRGLTYPQEITSAVVRDLIGGRPVKVAALSRFDEQLAVRLDAGGKPAPLFEALIRPSRGEDRMMRAGSGTFISLSAELPSALATAYEVAESRLVIEAALPSQKYDFVFSTARRDDLLHGLMRQAIEASFRLTGSREQRQLSTYVLGATPEAASRLQDVGPSDQGASYSTRGSSLQGVSMTMDDLTQALEAALGRPIVNETRLQGHYDIALTWKASDGESLRSALREQLGLSLEAGKRMLEVVVIRAAEAKRMPAAASSEGGAS